MSVFVPASYDPAQPMPVVVFLHGGGGNASNAQATTCPAGDTMSAGCLYGVGEAEGFITVFPNGYAPRKASPVRTWNAGGGGDYACASGPACRSGSDDISYLNSVLDEVEAEYTVETSRVYVMGFSNGAAMAHRVACEMAGRVAAVVAVSGANEYATDAPCDPGEPVSVMHVHGTADECWGYDTSLAACADEQPEPKVGVSESVRGWVATLACSVEPAVGTLPDLDADDGTTATYARYDGCVGGSEVELVTIEGGGHIYPGGVKVRGAMGSGDLASGDVGNEFFWEWLSQWERAGA